MDTEKVTNQIDAVSFLKGIGMHNGSCVEFVKIANHIKKMQKRIEELENENSELRISAWDNRTR